MSGQGAALARRRRRWRSFVAIGLIVAPFLPASNIFFWVSAWAGNGQMTAVHAHCFRGVISRAWRQLLPVDLFS